MSGRPGTERPPRPESAADGEEAAARPDPVVDDEAAIVPVDDERPAVEPAEADEAVVDAAVVDAASEDDVSAPDGADLEDADDAGALEDPDAADATDPVEEPGQDDEPDDADDHLDDEPEDDEPADDGPEDDEPVLDDLPVDEPDEDLPGDDDVVPVAVGAVVPVPVSVAVPAPVPADARPPTRPFPPDPADAARRRLSRALAPRLTRSQLLAAGVCAVLGFAGAVGVNQAQDQNLSSLRQSDLITVLDNVTQEGARLEDQAASLRQTLEQLRSSSDNAPAARQAAQTRLDALGVLAGTLPATGPGIELEIVDPRAAVQANDLLETVQELRDAGAEAMQIGSVRVVARTAFVDVDGGMLIDKQVVRPPYRLVAIGDPQTLSAALEIPGGVLEVLRGRGGQGTVRNQPSVTVSALLPLRVPQYARPAPSPAP